MPILLIHFSDIHLKAESNEILNRIAHINAAIRDKIADSDNILIVVSGDIAFSGKKEEYNVAQQFFSEFEKQLKAINASAKLEYIVVPGNHDCNFDLHGETRTVLLDSISKNNSLLDKTAILTDCVKPQQYYFEWALSIQSLETTNCAAQFVLQRVFQFPGGINIKFLAYNTAWMTMPEKGHGDIIFPMQLIPQSPEQYNFDLVFSVLHHPYNWIETEASKPFREVIEKSSNIILTGHEHDASYYETRYLGGETRQYIPGGELQSKQEGDPKSTFVTMLIDAANRKMKYSQYTWRDTIYHAEEHESLEIPPSRALKQDKFLLQKQFSDLLLKPGVPFSHPRLGQNLTIDDIYVFPDLEELLDKIEGEVIHSNKALDYLLANKKVCVFGPECSGKTSLLKVMFRKYRKNGVIPLLINGKEINTGNPERLRKIFDKAFVEEYGNQYLEDFWQLNPDQRALLLEDLQDCDLNKQAKLKLFDFINDQFGTVLISTSNIFAIQEIVKTEKNDFLMSCKWLALSEFGNVARNKLIQKWLVLGQEDTADEVQLDSKIREVDEKAKIILRPSLAPSYPFYILTIAQSVDNATMGIPTLSNEDRGSFGFFYEWLITTALHLTGRRIADLNAKYRYLSELAYYMFQKQKYAIDSEEMEVLHNSYLAKFSLRRKDLAYEALIDDLISANMLKLTNSQFEFSYPCIYYYFTARALNACLQHPKDEKEAKEIISALVNNIDQEESESILLFLSYLSENPYVRDILLQTAKQMFSQNAPTDLDHDLDFANTKSFSLTLNLPKEKPRELREKIQERQDEEQRKHKVNARTPTEEEGFDKQLKAMTKAFKMVRIMGQMIKNFATSWEGADKYPLVEESYLLGLRVLKEHLSMCNQTVEDFVKEVKDAIQYKHDADMLKLPENKRYRLTDSQLEIAARATVFSLTASISSTYVYAIAHCVGIDKLEPIYSQILDKHKHLISVRLIDIAIKLKCQTHLPQARIDELLKEIERNYVGFAILQHLVFNRLSLYEADPRERQICCKALQIKENDARLYLADRKIGKL